MSLVITEIAIAADGKYVVEIANTGATAIDVSNMSLIYEISGTAGQYGVSFTNLGVTSIAAGDIVTFGHSTLSGVDNSNPTFDQVFNPPSLGTGLAGVYIRENSGFTNLDHVGVRGGTDLGTDIVYTGLTGRTPKTDRDTDNISELSTSTPYTNAGFGTATCFAAGTMISTPDGATAVEKLRIDDAILTQDGQVVPVKWIGRQTLTKQTMGARMEPVRIRKGALGDGLPHSDLVVTADHGMIFDDVVINASALINGTSIDFVRLAQLDDSFTVYHVETEAHEAILANGAPSETFVDAVTRSHFDNYAEYLDLYGAERIIPEMNRLRVTSQRLLPQFIRDRTGLRKTA